MQMHGTRTQRRRSRGSFDPTVTASAVAQVWMQPDTSFGPKLGGIEVEYERYGLKLGFDINLPAQWSLIDLKRDPELERLKFAPAEVDEALAGLPIPRILERGVIGCTLGERLQLRLSHFVDTGQHLDEDMDIMCLGSRFEEMSLASRVGFRREEHIPIERYDPELDAVMIGWVHNQNDGSDLYARTMVLDHSKP
jgi:hypothetical protein